MLDQETTDAELTALLLRCSGGDRAAFDELYAILYRDIHAIAVRQLRSERHLTIRPTALVHEAYLRLANLHEIRWEGRSHLLAMAARVTRQALVDEARRRRSAKRDGGVAVTLSDENIGGTSVGHDALDVDDLLTELEGYDSVAAQIVSLRVFGGLSIVETAEHLEISQATVNRRWASGKAWLVRELARE
ncbi:MAG TPA: ECF-type sigma factor [Steroidobacteraceae bacterium]|nr:ECF-type sigma factor [Steroidobacteraceae bacterium]